MAEKEMQQKQGEPALSERRTFLKQVASAAVVAGAAGTAFGLSTAKSPANNEGTPENASQDIELDYDEATYGVTVAPNTIHVNTTIRFVNPKGARVRVVFLSPRGNETDSVRDSESCMMAIGGVYQFKCFFTPKGSNREIASATGGGVEVIPHKP